MKNASPDLTEALLRILILYFCHIVNRDAFVAAMYGQHVIHKEPMELLICFPPSLNCSIIFVETTKSFCSDFEFRMQLKSAFR